VSALADYELDLAIRGSHGSGLAVTQADLLANLRGQIRMAIGIGGKDPLASGLPGIKWIPPRMAPGSQCWRTPTTRWWAPVFAGQAQRWLDDILGTNSWGVSLIVGDGTVFRTACSTRSPIWSARTTGGRRYWPGRPVEGPNSSAATGTVPNMRACVAAGPGGVPYSVFNGHHAVFGDNVQSYSTVEPAIDLTALTRSRSPGRTRRRPAPGGYPGPEP